MKLLLLDLINTWRSNMSNIQVLPTPRPLPLQSIGPYGVFWSNRMTLSRSGKCQLLGRSLCLVVVQNQALDMRKFLMQVLTTLLFFPITRELLLILFIFL